MSCGFRGVPDGESCFHNDVQCRIPSKGSATVLLSKGKVRTFEKAVGEEYEFAHEYGECEFLGFADCQETLVERFEDWVVTGGHERGHVEG